MKVTITESIALATSSLGFIFSLISSFTPAWSVINGSNGTYHIGHIHGCDFTNESGKCRKLVQYLLNNHEEKASFTFMVFSIAFFFLSSIFFKVGWKPNKTEYVTIGGWLSVAGGISALLGVLIYAVYSSRSSSFVAGNLSFGYSFALASMASFSGVVAGILGLLPLLKQQGQLRFIKVRTRRDTVSSSNDV